MPGKKDKPDERTPQEKEAALNQGLAEADALLADKDTPLSRLKKKLIPLKAKYRLTRLEFVVVSEDMNEGLEAVQVEGEISPRGTRPPKPHNLRELVSQLSPINAKYRGHVVTIISGPLKGTSVRYDALGFPDFSPFAISIVTIEMRGNYSYADPDGDF